jgi:shikimate dehydrogenase
MMKDIFLLGVIGNPVKHSRSPRLHNAWLGYLKMPGFYTPIPVQNEAYLGEVLKTMPKMGFIGCNITLPYKNSVFNILSSHEKVIISQEALKLKATNTIVFANDHCELYNTDVYGFEQTILAYCQGIELSKTKVLVCGAGGASRAIIYALVHLGAHIQIVNRDFAKAQAIRELFAGYSKIDVDTYENASFNVAEFGVIVNTTSASLHNELPGIDYNNIKSNAVCIDVAYTNNGLTTFLQYIKAIKPEAKLHDGMLMLVKQAEQSFRIWTGFEGQLPLVQ